MTESDSSKNLEKTLEETQTVEKEKNVEKKEEGEKDLVERDESTNEIFQKFNLSESMRITFPRELKSLPKKEIYVQIQTTKQILAAAELSRQYLLRDLASEYLQVIDYVNGHMPTSNKVHGVNDEVEGEDMADTLKYIMRENRRFHNTFQEEDSNRSQQQQERQQNLPEEETESMVIEVPPQAMRRTAKLPADEEKQEEASERPMPPHVQKEAQDTSDKISTRTSTSTENYTDRNKNRYRKCPMCDFFGTHLKRHLLARHPDTVISKS